MMQSTHQLVNGQKIVDVAQTLIGTPYQHQGRMPGVGLDCIGVPLVVGWELKLIGNYYNPQNYARDADGSLIPNLQKFCDRKCIFEPGLIAVFKFSAQAHHVGILTRFRDDWGLLHAYQNVGAVKEHQLDRWWRDKIVDLFGFRGVDYLL
jgi:hypothetical protein